MRKVLAAIALTATLSVPAQANILDDLGRWGQDIIDPGYYYLVVNDYDSLQNRAFLEHYSNNTRGLTLEECRAEVEAFTARHYKRKWEGKPDYTCRRHPD